MVLLIALMACGTSEGTGDETSAPDGTADTAPSETETPDETGAPGDDSAPPSDSAPDTAPPAEDGVTWYADVSPLLQRHCTRCHQEDGLGVGDFNSYPVAAAMAEIMLSQIDAGEMPPPASDPECRDYLGAEHLVLPDDARDTLAAWIAAGAPEGDPADAVAQEGALDTLVGADAAVYPAVDYAPNFSREGNEYRCFVVDGLPEEDFYITAMHPEIDEWSVVHHIVLHTVRDGALDPAYTQPEGFDCYGGEHGAITESAIGVWAPGMLPVELPEGVGVPMRGGQRMVLEFHYYDPGDLEPGAADQSGYTFRTTELVETEAFPYTWGITDMVIPADVAAYSRTSSVQVPAGLDLTLYTVWPHMHVLGSGYELYSADQDGVERCVVASDGYDFENQYVYAFTEPFVAGPLSELEFTCTWNNSSSNDDLIHDPPVATAYGPNTEDEMCFFYGLYSYADTETGIWVGEVMRGEVALLESQLDLDLDGELVFAANFGGAGPTDIDGVSFSAAAGPAYSAASTNVPDFDEAPASLSGVETVAASLAYNTPWEPLTLEYPVEAGREYRLQLIFFENYYSRQGFRRLDVTVDGEQVISALDAHTQANTAGIVYTLDLTADDDTLSVVVEGAPGGDGYPLISGLTLEAR